MYNFFNSIIAIAEQSQAHMEFLLMMLGLLWVAFALTLASGRMLLILGIHPRKLFGLIGIIFSPFLHANFNHIFFNSIPFFLLSNFVLFGGINFYLNISLYIIVISGLLTWIFARPAIHIGASSLVTGYWSFLVLSAYNQEGILSTLLGIICVYYFAGIFFGIFPKDKGVSWEGHLFGFIAGIALNLSLSFNYLPLINFSQWF